MLELAEMRAIDEGVARQSVRRFRRTLLLQILPGALAAPWIGMAGAAEPPGKIPPPEEIFAFGNAPATGAPEPGTGVRILTVGDLSGFLREGARKPREEKEA